MDLAAQIKTTWFSWQCQPSMASSPKPPHKQATATRAAEAISSFSFVCSALLCAWALLLLTIVLLIVGISACLVRVYCTAISQFTKKSFKSIACSYATRLSDERVRCVLRLRNIYNWPFFRFSLFLSLRFRFLCALVACACAQMLSRRNLFLAYLIAAICCFLQWTNIELLDSHFREIFLNSIKVSRFARAIGLIFPLKNVSIGNSL